MSILQTLRSPLVRTLRRLRLLQSVRYLKLFGVRASINELRYEFLGAPDNLPLPPQRLHELIVGTNRPLTHDYLQLGHACADGIVSLLRKHGESVLHLAPILDFGCGCGRVVRHLWTTHPGLAVWGSDINAEQVAWCRDNLPFATLAVNRPEPPLPFPDNTFGLAYAFSVFTHLPAEMQRPWLLELARVLRPGGYLILSLHGVSLIARLTPAERATFSAGGLVVHRPEAANIPALYASCGAYHPPGYVFGEFAQGLSVLAHLPAAPGIGQDLYLFQKPA
jgi:SAM-dependent methyltransferase